MTHCVARTGQRAAEVYVEDAIEVLNLDLMARSTLLDAGIVDENATRDLTTLFVAPGLLRLAPVHHILLWISGGAGYALFEESFLGIDGASNPAPRVKHRGASCSAVVPTFCCGDGAVEESRCGISSARVHD